ncbi:MAG: thiol peroxidase [Candidatus Brocadiia bacterium]
MEERSGLVTLHGKPVTLVGQPLEVGDPVPDVELLDGDLEPVPLTSFRGKTLVLATVPSLDTDVCDREARTFNQRATELGEGVALVVASVDLPFAQSRWCGAAGVDRVHTLSDHRDVACGRACGVLIKELRLLARAIFVADADGTVRYAQLVPEVASEPDYEEAIAAVQALA